MTLRTIAVPSGEVSLEVVDGEHGRCLRVVHDPLGPEVLVPLGLVVELLYQSADLEAAVEALLAEEGLT